MIRFHKMSSSSPDKRRDAPSSNLKIRRSTTFRNIHSLMDARVKPAHDGVRAS
jgi:hypothetical protein